MKKLICLLLTLLMSVGCLCACRDDKNEPPGEFYSLEEAYEKGWISKNDLINIAYYKNGNKLFEEVENFTPSPKNPETLSEETENAIKETLVYITNQDNSNTKATKNDFEIFKYYGTYNDVVAIMTINNFSRYLTVTDYIIIDGITCYYADSNRIKIWKSNK